MPKLFDDEEIAELAQIFGLTPVLPTPEPPGRKIRDGYATEDCHVWWRGERGPEYVHCSDLSHWANLLHYPHLYSHAVPVIKRVEYAE